jgi:ankyrin repeat protein
MSRYPSSYKREISNYVEPQPYYQNYKKYYDCITKNLDKIIELYNDEKYDDVHTLFYDGLVENTGSIEWKVVWTLLWYCEQYDNVDFIENILSTMIVEDSPLYLRDFVVNVVDNNKIQIFTTILDCINIQPIFDIIFIAILKNENKISFLDILIEKGYKIRDTNINTVIRQNDVEVIEYLIEKNYDIQSVLLHMTLRSYNLKLQTLKLLIKYNLNIEKLICPIIELAIKYNDLDVVVYMKEIFPYCDINIWAQNCYRYNNVNILKYLCQNGVDVQYIDTEYMSYGQTVDIFKFLIDNNCNIGKKTLDNICREHFIKDTDLNNTYYLVKYGADIEKCIVNKIRMTDKKNILINEHYTRLTSPLEYITSVGKIGHIKYLVENYYHLIQPQINKLFIIACANGQNEIVKYLYTLNVRLDEKALISACFFGHLNTVNLLLEFGMDIYDTKENLFVVIDDGIHSSNIPSLTYNNLINDDDVFVNDVYNFGIQHSDILKLLIKYRVQIPEIPRTCNYYVMFHDVETMRYFLDSGMDINTQVTWTVNYISLLDRSLRLGNIDVAKLLLEYGIEPIIDDKTFNYIKTGNKAADLVSLYNITC